jgi:hypothetical protein
MQWMTLNTSITIKAMAEKPGTLTKSKSRNQSSITKKLISALKDIHDQEYGDGQGDNGYVEIEAARMESEDDYQEECQILYTLVAVSTHATVHYYYVAVLYYYS